MFNTQTVKEFINDELREFSNYDNIRSIPSLVDGFKDAQRKAVYGMKLYGNTPEKVSRLTGKIAIATNYAHGEISMSGTIIGLAQNFTGSNNVNLCKPIGQFGSILSPESASERYISTEKSEWFDKIINKEDDLILEYNYDEGHKSEPVVFYPTLPLWLVNGVIGVGTGHSCRIVSRNPKSIAALIKKIIKGDKLTDKAVLKYIEPYYRGWKGTVNEIEPFSGRYEFNGSYEIINSTKIRITELPIGIDHDKYKQTLIDLMDKGIIKDYDSNSTEDGFDFDIAVPRETSRKSHEEIMKLFKLTSRRGENVTLWNKDGKLVKYDNVYEALKEFVSVKLESLEQRKEAKLNKYQNDIDFMNEKASFIKLFLQLSDKIKKMKTSDVIDHMVSNNISKTNAEQFIRLSLSSLTVDKIDELNKQIKVLSNEKKTLEGMTNQDLYEIDLKGF